MKLKLFTGLILLTIFMSTGMSLNVDIANQLITVSQGDVADYLITVSNPGSAKNVLVTIDSEVPTTVSDPAFYLTHNAQKEIHIFAMTNGLGEDLYLITLNIDEQDYELALRIREGAPTLFFNSVYDDLVVTQGEFQDLRFLIRNEGEGRLRNIVIEGDIPLSLNPKYPSVFDLDPNEVREIKIRITVPDDYPSDEYEFVVKAGSGNTISSDKVKISVEGDEPIAERLDMDILLPWQSIKEDGNTIGYKLTVRVRNRGISDMSNVCWRFEGMPEDWEVSGDEEFDVKGYETLDVVLEIVPSEFVDAPVDITLMKGNEVITEEKVTFSGYKIGLAPTGYFLFGGSVLVGVIIIVILVIVLLYVRQRGATRGMEEETKTYLEKLVEKAKEEERKTKRRK